MHTWDNSFAMRAGLHHALVKDSITVDVERSRKSVNHPRTKAGRTQSIKPNVAPASEAIFTSSRGQRDSTENNDEPVLMARVAALATSAISGGSSVSFFFRLCAMNSSTGICWKRQTRITEFAESCIYWTNLSLADDEDGNDHKCDSNKDQARKIFT